MTLNKKEKILMNVIYNSAVSKNGQCIVSSLEIFERIPLKVEFNEYDLEPVMKELVAGNYFTYEMVTRKGEDAYCIILKEAGKSYIRDKKVSRKKLIIRILTTIGIALLGVLVKFILNKITG